ncbi:hypothetical protein IMZ48_20330, partial [Candidatus Bathyarchaeota archaeon]|nr:hypothetical protein [Candidatus Bathyarchaeota archaeon]
PNIRVFKLMSGFGHTVIEFQAMSGDEDYWPPGFIEEEEDWTMGMFGEEDD